MRGICIAGFAASASGCALNGSVDDIDTGSAMSAVCTDRGATDYSAQLILGDVGGSVSATSSTTYGSPLCLGRFVVQAFGTAGEPNLTAEAVYAGPGLNQAACNSGSGSVSMLVYGFNGTSWVQLGGEHTATGVWTILPFGGNVGYCDISVGISVSSAFDRVRVAARATLQTVFGPISMNVSDTVFSHF